MPGLGAWPDNPGAEFRKVEMNVGEFNTGNSSQVVALRKASAKHNAHVSPYLPPFLPHQPSLPPLRAHHTQGLVLGEQGCRRRFVSSFRRGQVASGLPVNHLNVNVRAGSILVRQSFFSRPALNIVQKKQQGRTYGSELGPWASENASAGKKVT